MGKRFFKGKLDLDSLSIPDMAKATQALAMLQELEEKGVIEFTVGTSRESGTIRKEPVMRMVPQRKKVVEAMQGRDWTPGAEIAAMTGIGPNSIGPTLSALVQMGLLERQDTGVKGGPTPKYNYRLSDAGKA